MLLRYHHTFETKHIKPIFNDNNHYTALLTTDYNFPPSSSPTETRLNLGEPIRFTNMKLFTTIMVAAIGFAMTTQANHDRKCMPLVRPCSKRALESREAAFSPDGTRMPDSVKEIEIVKDD